MLLLWNLFAIVHHVMPVCILLVVKRFLPHKISILIVEINIQIVKLMLVRIETIWNLPRRLYYIEINKILIVYYLLLRQKACLTAFWWLRGWAGIVARRAGAWRARRPLRRRWFISAKVWVACRLCQIFDWVVNYFIIADSIINTECIYPVFINLVILKPVLLVIFFLQLLKHHIFLNIVFLLAAQLLISNRYLVEKHKWRVIMGLVI